MHTNDLYWPYSQSSRLLDILVTLSFHQNLNLLESYWIHFCRYKVYRSKTGSLDLEKKPPTSTSITLYIRRAYPQAYLLVDIKPEDFGYLHNENEQFIPQITNNFLIPESFPKPCSCLKCTRKKSLWMPKDVFHVLQILQMWFWRWLSEFDRPLKFCLTHILYFMFSCLNRCTQKCCSNLEEVLVILNFW